MFNGNSKEKKKTEDYQRSKLKSKDQASINKQYIFGCLFRLAQVKFKWKLKVRVSGDTWYLLQQALGYVVWQAKVGRKNIEVGKSNNDGLGELPSHAINNKSWGVKQHSEVALVAAMGDGLMCVRRGMPMLMSLPGYGE